MKIMEDVKNMWSISEISLFSNDCGNVIPVFV